jgi:2-polyprenyl-6-hydroxyphenyl methylase/3-demethylubiquinone-9 3-methyltransferase
MWKSLYRLLSPGGRIVVTTPSYFSRGLMKDMRSVLSLRGPGLSVRDIVETNTYGHHWRLYSVRDIGEYFRILSPDFRIGRVAHFDTRRPRRGMVRALKRRLRQTIPFLLDSLYVEVELPGKQAGITVQPHW